MRAEAGSPCASTAAARATRSPVWWAADGLVGPPLAGVGGRAYIAGVLTNTPDHLIRWIVDPVGVDPLTAMPITGVSEREARDIATFLYTVP